MRKNWYEKILRQNQEEINKKIEEFSATISKKMEEEFADRRNSFCTKYDLVILVKDNKTLIYEHGKR